MLVNGKDNFIRVKRQFLGRRLNNPGISLMRNDPVNVGWRQVCRGKHLVQYIGEIGHGMAEHLATLHPQLADGARGGWTAIDI